MNMSGISDSQNQDEDEASIAGSKNDHAAAAACVDVLGMIAPTLLVDKNVSAVSQQPEQKTLCGIKKNASSQKFGMGICGGNTDVKDCKSTAQKEGATEKSPVEKQECEESPKKATAKNTVDEKGCKKSPEKATAKKEGRGKRHRENFASKEEENEAQREKKRREVLTADVKIKKAEKEKKRRESLTAEQKEKEAQREIKRREALSAEMTHYSVKMQ